MPADDGSKPLVASKALREPRTLPIDGDPNGLFWDQAGQRLLVADDDGNRILQWTDQHGFELVQNLLASAGKGPGLGQLVMTADGTIFVTRFGHGTTGDVVRVPRASEPEIVPGLDPTRRRIGLAVSSTGQLFDAWFARADDGSRQGAISQLEASGGEREVIAGLTKPIGVLVLAGRLFVSDQDRGQILAAPLDNPAQTSVFASIPGPDLLASGPDGSVFSGSTSGAVYWIDASGVASELAKGFGQVRGVAYDPAQRRLFVADHDANAADGVKHSVRVLPIEASR